MGGPRLTPEQIERAAEVYARTGNLSESARAIGVAVETLRYAFKRLRIAKNRQLHAEACERGIREQRERLRRLSSIAESVIGNAGELEPKDLAALMNATSKAADTMVTFASREDSRKQSKLTREKTRAETELIRARIAGTLPAEKVDVSHDARDALVERLARLARTVEPGSPRPGDPPPETGGG